MRADVTFRESAATDKSLCPCVEPALSRKSSARPSAQLSTLPTAEAAGGMSSGVPTTGAYGAVSPVDVDCRRCSGPRSPSTSLSSEGESGVSGPLWIEDPFPLKRRSCEISDNESAGGGTPSRPQRSPRVAINTFNKAKSAEKGFAELFKQGLLPDLSVEHISSFLIRNDGKLDLGKVTGSK